MAVCPANLPAGKAPLLALLILVVGPLSGCSSTPAADGAPESASYDPWEPMNRGLYRMNVAVDKATLRPLAKGYRAVTPNIAEHGISNFFDNLTTPGSALNNFLQGKPARGFSEFGRFLFNSTLGVGGLFDVAGAGGMDRYDETFSQTFAVWGVPEGPYLMLPFLGPHSLLDAAALPFDYYTDFQAHYDNASVRDKLAVLRLVSVRARLLSADGFLDESNDPYIAFREAYRQNREYQIYDGDPPVDDDYYEFMDGEFMDEEFMDEELLDDESTEQE
jgi:phospholipid-binding lipoprotein MlaA